MGFTSIESKTKIESIGHFKDGKLFREPKGYEDYDVRLDITEAIEEISMPEGQYKITITLERTI